MGLLLTPLWSYLIAGGANHWWFVARNMSRKYYYVAQFCFGENENIVSGNIFSDETSAVACGLQYQGADWWYARDWAPCAYPRAKTDLDRMVTENPIVKTPYSWVDNNCQHFALLLQEGDAPFAV